MVTAAVHSGDLLHDLQAAGGLKPPQQKQADLSVTIITMGSFAGHILPGSFFIIFGLWWWFHILATIAKAQAKFFKCRHKRGINNFEFATAFVSSTWQKVPVPCLRALPVEPGLKVVAAAVGIIGELSKANWSLLDKAGRFSSLNNFSHATMFAVFLLGAVMEILRFYSILFLPPATDHVLASLAFFVVGELFYFHIDGRSVLDQNLHIIIYTLAFLISVVVLLEAWQRTSFILFMARTVLVFLLGTWFIQVGYVLYGANPWKDTYSNRAFVAIAFSWHLTGVLLTFLCSLVLLSVCIRLKRWSHVGSLAASGSAMNETAELENLMITEQATEE